HKIYYPLEHDRLWPDLLPVLMAYFIPSPGAQKSLERELNLALTSRLDYIQLRAKTLEPFLSRTSDPVPSPDQLTTAAPLVQEGIESPADQPKAPRRSAEKPVSRETTEAPAPKKKKKQPKSAQDQLKLF
ncbi:MAG TPA: hypothetical protein VK564_01500, partial [Thermodesulfobacteriota bacterium]|nr:hypothetical protein [Thermodesulfobacteriota bacterium]